MANRKQLQSIIRTINELLNDSNVRNLNAGGCGVFADALCTKLNAVGINAEPILLTYRNGYDFHKDDDEVIDYVTNNSHEIESARNIQVKGLAIAHVVVKVNNYYLDSSGVYDTWQQLYRHHWMLSSNVFAVPLSHTVVTKIASNSAGWNDMYNRSNNIKVYEAVDRALFHTEKLTNSINANLNQTNNQNKPKTVWQKLRTLIA